jgi:hypothetical protein
LEYFYPAGHFSASGGLSGLKLQRHFFPNDSALLPMFNKKQGFGFFPKALSRCCFSVN